MAHIVEETRLKGYALIQLLTQDGDLKHSEVVENLITDTGDLYYSTRAIALVAPSNTPDATKMTGMKLGTGTTAPGKNTAGHVLGTYITGSNKVFDASFPAVSNLGAGLGVESQYQVTWGAGVVTNSAITEAVIVNDSSTDATSTAGNTTARIKFTAIDKQANDILIILWRHKFLGA